MPPARRSPTWLIGTASADSVPSSVGQLVSALARCPAQSGGDGQKTGRTRSPTEFGTESVSVPGDDLPLPGGMAGRVGGDVQTVAQLGLARPLLRLDSRRARRPNAWRIVQLLSLIHISEPTRQAEISYA